MWQIILLIVGILLGVSLIVSVVLTFYIAYRVYSGTLMRGKIGAWGRDHCSEPGCVPLETMWKRSLIWGEANKSFMKKLIIKSKDGLTLYGEWFDYGFDRTVIILPGRREVSIYSYYYSKPYQSCGFNVLAIDQRAHGLSGGKYSTGGIKEAEDVSLWMKYLHNELNQRFIYLHGICVGTCCATIVATKYKTDYLKALILDSAFISYKEIYKNHYKEAGHALFPVYYEVWFWFRFFGGCKIDDSNPEKYMPSFDLPVLFLWGTKDIYCLPEKSKILFEKCGSKDKQIEWFDGAEHSRVRLFDEERYDALVSDFLARHM